jgi:hypothetical protein
MNLPTVATPPARKRRRWLRGALAALALAIIVPIGVLTYSHFSTRGDWAGAEEEAGRDDPRWRLLEMEADRPTIADADNSAFYIIALRSKGGINPSAVPTYEAIFAKLPPSAQLNSQQVQLIRTEFAKFPGQIEAARKLKDMPAGRFPLTFSDDWISTTIGNHQNTREIVGWLQHDAWLLAQEGDCDAAIESCQAIINTSRSVKDDPFLITCLIRIAEQAVALETLERVLAQGEASEEHLRAMQAMLEREMREDSFILALRGERAGCHYLFENIRSGKIKQNPFAVLGGPNVNTGNLFDDFLVQAVPSTMLRYYPDYLRHMNRMVEAAKLPLHERGGKLAELEAEVKRTRNPVIRLLVPAMQKVEMADRRVQIYMRSMNVAIACERYRLQDEQKRWPATLDDLVKAKLLNAVPTDPIDNQPLRYRRTREGVVIYSVGFDGKDDQGNIDRENWRNPGVDLGYRLWNPEQRRRQPLPPVGLPAGN